MSEWRLETREYTDCISPDMTETDTVMSNTSLSLSLVLEEYGKLFYIIHPGRNSFPSVEAVPDYVQQAMPYMVTLILLEVGFLLQK